jgi:hypothetical protein
MNKLQATLIACFMCMSSPVFAQDVAKRTVAYNPVTNVSSFLSLEKTSYGADLIFSNQFTAESCCSIFTLEIDSVKVVVKVTTTGPTGKQGVDGSKYADIVEVLEVSNGLIAYPESMFVEEEDVGVIQIMPGMS